MKTCFIVNPVAGKGRALKTMDKLASGFSQLGLPVIKFTTSGVGDATRLASLAVQDGYELVVVVGGDGTVCEVAQGLVNTDTVMAIAPGGTGNDYCRVFGMSRKKTDVIKMLNTGTVRTVDCMQVDEFVGINISTVGFDSEVVKNASRYSWAGGLSYLLSVLHTVRHYRSPVMTVTFDDGTSFTGTRFLVAAGSGTHYGGGIKILPNAVPDDGVLDFCVIDSVRLPGDYFKLLPKIVKGTHKSSDTIHMGRLNSLTIESEFPLTLNIDGNLFENRHNISMSILPGALKILTPQGV